MDWESKTSIHLIVSDLNDIAADLYRHRIRSASRNGGGGAYDRSRGGFPYVLPPRLEVNHRATFQITSLTADAVGIKAIQRRSLDSSSVVATVNERGKLTGIFIQRKGELQKP